MRFATIRHCAACQTSNQHLWTSKCTVPLLRSLHANARGNGREGDVTQLHSAIATAEWLTCPECPSMPLQEVESVLGESEQERKDIRDKYIALGEKVELLLHQEERVKSSAERDTQAAKMAVKEAVSDLEMVGPLPPPFPPYLPPSCCFLCPLRTLPYEWLEPNNSLVHHEPLFAHAF